MEKYKKRVCKYVDECTKKNNFYMCCDPNKGCFWLKNCGDVFSYCKRRECVTWFEYLMYKKLKEKK